MVRSLSSGKPTINPSKATVRRRLRVPGTTVLAVNGKYKIDSCSDTILKDMNASGKIDAEYQCGGFCLRKCMKRTVLTKKLSPTWLKSAMLGGRATDGEGPDRNDRFGYVDSDHTLHPPKASSLLHT